MDEFLARVGPEFDAAAIELHVGTGDLDELFEFIFAKSDLSPLVHAGFTPAACDKLYNAIMEEQAARKTCAAPVKQKGRSTRAPVAIAPAEQKGRSTRDPVADGAQVADIVAALMLEFSEVEQRLKSMPADQRRSVQSLLGLAVGDAAGLPFEFDPYNRGEADELWWTCAEPSDAIVLLDGLIFRKIFHRTERASFTPFCRSYSDDTACADIKMQAVATIAARAGGHSND